MHRLTVRVVPRASRTEIVGAWEDGVKIRVAAPPVDGAANDELIRFLARRLGLPRAAIHIVSGATGRTKGVRIDGAPADLVSTLLGA